MRDLTNVVLTTARQTPGTNYTVTVSGVRDLSGNTIAASSTNTFTAFSYVSGFAVIEFFENAGFASGTGSLDQLRETNEFLTPSRILVNTAPETGSRFRVVVNAPGISTNSAEATVTIQSDQAPPTLVSALRHFAQSNQVTVLFSELMEPASANVAANYTINNGITVSSAMLGTNGRSVHLTTSPIPSGTTNTLTVSGVRDLAGNTIAANAGIYAYEKGEMLTDGTPAPERRIHFFMTDNVASAMNEAGFRLWDAAVNWAQGLAVDQPPSEVDITVTRGTGGNITIQWTGGGTLQSTTSLTPPVTWTDETGNGSVTVPTTGPAKFYRVRQ